MHPIKALHCDYSTHSLSSRGRETNFQCLTWLNHMWEITRAWMDSCPSPIPKLFYAAICAILRKIGWLRWLDYPESHLPRIHMTRCNQILAYCHSWSDNKGQCREKYRITWISWILLNPSFQKNSIKLAMVLGPGISFRVFTLVFSPTSVAVIRPWGTVSSPAAEIRRASLAADLCKARRMRNSGLFRASLWKLLQHTFMIWFMLAITLKILKSFRAQKCFQEVACKARRWAQLHICKCVFPARVDLVPRVW